MTKFQSGRNKAITGRRNRCHSRNLPELPTVLKHHIIIAQQHVEWVSSDDTKTELDDREIGLFTEMIVKLGVTSGGFETIDWEITVWPKDHSSIRKI